MGPDLVQRLYPFYTFHFLSANIMNNRKCVLFLMHDFRPPLVVPLLLFVVRHDAFLAGERDYAVSGWQSKGATILRILSSSMQLRMLVYPYRSTMYHPPARMTIMALLSR